MFITIARIEKIENVLFACLAVSAGYIFGIDFDYTIATFFMCCSYAMLAVVCLHGNRLSKIADASELTDFTANPSQRNVEKWDGNNATESKIWLRNYMALALTHDLRILDAVWILDFRIEGVTVKQQILDLAGKVNRYLKEHRWNKAYVFGVVRLPEPTYLDCSFVRGHFNVTIIPFNTEEVQILISNHMQPWKFNIRFRLFPDGLMKEVCKKTPNCECQSQTFNTVFDLHLRVMQILIPLSNNE